MSSFFKSLTRGVKFDTERFLDDAIRLQIVKDPAATCPTFPTKSTSIADEIVQSTKKRRQDEDEDDDDDLPIFKRDRKTEAGEEQKKQKKKKAPRNLKKEAEEKLRHLRRSLAIYVSGSDIPPPVQEFGLIPGMTDQMLTNITNCGYAVPTAVQMQTFPVLVEGRELLACAPTGSGKSAAFLIPIILLLGRRQPDSGVRAVILSPTKELAIQIHAECKRLADGTDLKVLNLAAKKNAPNFQCDILISTPNSLVYALKEAKLSLPYIRLLIVDECDNLFEEGFQDQLGFVYSTCAGSPDLKCAFFSATYAQRVEEFCKAHLDSLVSISVGAKNSAVDQVDQSLVFVGTEAGKLVELRSMFRKGIQPPVLIFVQSKERAEELHTELRLEKIDCGVVHAGRNEAERGRTVEGFRNGKVWVLICTTLLARGMDFPAVRTVINYDMPASHVTYIHSIGRTGRAGRTGKAITFFTEADRPNLARIAQVLRNAGFPMPPFVFRLKRARKDEMRVPKRKHISRRAVEVRKAARQKKAKRKKIAAAAGEKKKAKSGDE